MKEIIPIKKDILFKTTIGEITSINLEHNYKVKDEIIEGNLLLSGSYKMTEASVLEEDFYYKIPFAIALTKKIKKDSIVIDIEDFKYNIIKDVLNINVLLELKCEEEKFEELKESNEVEIINEEKSDNIENEIINDEVKINEDISNITNNIVNNENKYYTYKIYIVRQNDTVESICNKYNVTLDDLNEYNDLSVLNIGDKIIIPDKNE